jgi:hypothetical protein
VGTGNAAGGIGIHAVGNAMVPLLLVVPPLKQWARSLLIPERQRRRQVS